MTEKNSKIIPLKTKNTKDVHPIHTAYMVAIMRNNKMLNQADLTDFLLLGRHPDNLKYTMYVKKGKEQQNDKKNHVVTIQVNQFEAYALIDNPDFFSKFIDDYVSGPALDNPPYITPQLLRDFYVSPDKSQAVKWALDLKKKQDIYYQGLVTNAQKQGHKSIIQVIDLYKYMLLYVRDHDLPAIVREKEFVKRFNKTSKQVNNIIKKQAAKTIKEHNQNEKKK